MFQQPIKNTVVFSISGGTSPVASNGLAVSVIANGDDLARRRRVEGEIIKKAKSFGVISKTSSVPSVCGYIAHDKVNGTVDICCSGFTLGALGLGVKNNLNDVDVVIFL